MNDKENNKRIVSSTSSKKPGPQRTEMDKNGF